MNRASCRVLAWCALASALIAVSTVDAQGVDPRGGVRTISTTHFRVHFRIEHERHARALATYAEQAWTALASELKTPAFPVDVLLADNVDDSNGYAQVFPSNRIVVYAVPPIGIPELRFHDVWLRLVMTHELAHIFHIDRANGLWRAGRWMFGRNTMLFPNALLPSWVKEGVAVHYESKTTGSGRIVSTESRTVARAAARADAVPRIDRWSSATSRFPRGQTPYAWGSLLMHRAATVAGDSSMRRFIEYTAGFRMPFLLDRASRIGFGTSFSSQANVMRDSLTAVVASMDTTGDTAWRIVDRSGWFAAAPRWRGNDSLVWSASNGRDVTGMFTTSVTSPQAPIVRVAWRNSMDANVPINDDSVVFAQSDLRDLFTLRSDLYVGHRDNEARLTRGARLIQPDVSRDGQIVAVQVDAATSRLVLVTRAGEITRLTTANSWAEPRWSPDARRLAAVELLPSGEERVVVLDASGRAHQIVAGGLAVFASPSFTPDGNRLVWSSDRSGRMQLETARVSARADTVGWRDERADVRVASDVTTGVYEPTISPDGRLVAALLYQVDGSHVAIAPLDTLGPVARHRWYAEAQRAALAASANGRLGTRSAAMLAESTTIARAAVRRYSPVRQVLPQYWMPIVGEGRDGATTFGAASSGNDILQRHAWSADLSINPTTREVDGGATYRYAGLGTPLLDVDWQQAWDGTFSVLNAQGQRIGGVARRRRFTTVTASFPRPRIRRTVSSNVGVQYESRDFTADIDSVLGGPESLLRRGTRYPLLFGGASISTTRRASRAVSAEEGLTVGISGSYRWRQDAPSLASWRGILNGRGYLPLDLPGYARHVIKTAFAIGAADNNASTEFSVGGVSGVTSALLPGIAVGDPSRLFPVRGVSPGAQVGTRAIATSVEYRAPLVMFRTVPSAFTVFADRASIAVFTDAARAWCPAALARTTTSVCERPGTRDGWIASAGAELVLDLALQYDSPFRLRLGAAMPYLRPSDVPSRNNFYITLGSLF